ncbi:hypothetical protein [Rhodococcoides fascians]|uniref:hypothetical protein n=1 Tax=Rhodococcoides fascians TaxID=1828 RepID=UPI00050C2174|nr:hypothetical protein [Rhodococcus fascians]AMY53431.1 hypothetical protein A3L23_02087 [Rhodococcus fascians D188]
MALPSYLNFDESELASYDQRAVDKALREHPAIYLNHLEIAEHLDAWAAAVDRDHTSPPGAGGAYQTAIREIAAHLRQADYVPGGTMLEGGVR